ncbi:MAG: Crp/Fnr family transcriptional regulator [Pseudomonadota bacterium]
MEQAGAIFLSEYILELNEGAPFMDSIGDEARSRLRAMGKPCSFAPGETVFLQGQAHSGIWVIESGSLRTFYIGPSGREITLAFWTPGHFAGGPEVFGRGRHIWSADAVDRAEALFLTGSTLRDLVETEPAIAVAVIDGLIQKGKCYSALIQMLGTRTVSERLEQLLLILAQSHGRREGGAIVIDRTITYEQIAAVVGATRQWVTKSLDRLEKIGAIEVSRKVIRIVDIQALGAEG